MCKNCNISKLRLSYCFDHSSVQLLNIHQLQKNFCYDCYTLYEVFVLGIELSFMGHLFITCIPGQPYFQCRGRILADIPETGRLDCHRDLSASLHSRQGAAPGRCTGTECHGNWLTNQNHNWLQ